MVSCSHGGTQRADTPQKLYAVLAYLGFLCIIPLVVKKRDPFVLFHIKQGLVIFIAAVVSFVVSIIPGIGHILGLAGLSVCVICALFGIFQSLRGTRVAIPFVARLADKLVF